MPYTPTGLSLATTGALPTTVSLHTADPGNTGASEVSGVAYARQAIAFTVTDGAADSNAQITFTVPAGTTVTHVGYWQGLDFVASDVVRDANGIAVPGGATFSIEGAFTLVDVDLAFTNPA